MSLDIAQGILDETSRTINGPRQADYGHPRINFANIATGWSILLGCDVSPRKVALCMAWLKLAREVPGAKRDSMVDLAGYAALAEELEPSEQTLELVHGPQTLEARRRHLLEQIIGKFMSIAEFNDQDKPDVILLPATTETLPADDFKWNDLHEPNRIPLADYEPPAELMSDEEFKARYKPKAKFNLEEYTAKWEKVAEEYKGAFVRYDSDKDGETRPPHCDMLVLHAQGQCKFCDMHPTEQSFRIENRINFTGQNIPGWKKCPAEVMRGDTCQKWGGNLPHKWDLDMEME